MACLNSSFSEIAAPTHVVAAIKMAKQNRRMSDASIPSTYALAFPDSYPSRGPEKYDVRGIMALFCQTATRRAAGADRLRRKSPKPDIGGLKCGGLLHPDDSLAGR